MAEEEEEEQQEEEDENKRIRPRERALGQKSYILYLEKWKKCHLRWKKFCYLLISALFFSSHFRRQNIFYICNWQFLPFQVLP